MISTDQDSINKMKRFKMKYGQAYP